MSRKIASGARAHLMHIEVDNQHAINLIDRLVA
jgi:hypothetical protein